MRHDPLLAPQWTDWYHDSFIRGLNPAQGSVRRVHAASLEELASSMKSAWLESQINYHNSTANKYRFMADLLEHISVAIFVLVLLSAVPSLLAALHLVDLMPKVTILVIAVGGPALAAAAHGLRVQGEFVRLRLSSERLSRRLRSLLLRMESLEQSPKPPAAEFLAPLEAIAGDAAREMLLEVDDWHAAYRIHHPPIT